MDKILLIYNNDDNIRDLNIKLVSSGFSTYLAEDVSNGIEIAKIYTPDLILCDLVSNGISGVEVVKELSGNDRTKIIPLLFMTNSPDFHEMREIMNAGADDYISHNAPKNELINSIITRLDKYKFIKARYDEIRTETIEANGDLPVAENHVLVKIGTNLRIIKFEEIVCVSAAKEYSEVITKDSKKIIIRKSLRKWSSILPVNTFLQIHRSTIINVDYIENLKQLNEQQYEIKMKNCREPFQVSVRNAKKLKKWFYT